MQENPLFIKIEKDFEIPRTQKHQIKREIAGISLCKAAGIIVPAILNSDITKTVCGNALVMEEFIKGKLIGEYTIGKENKRILGEEFEAAFRKILTIESNFYGDTFENGIIGKHDTWQCHNKNIGFIIW
jgi:hypothetical protein